MGFFTRVADQTEHVRALRGFNPVRLPRRLGDRARGEVVEHRLRVHRHELVVERMRRPDRGVTA